MVLFLVLLVSACMATDPFLPDEILNVTQMIRRRGYPAEDHSCVTKDNFTLSLQRMPRPGAPVVFLLHGFLDASSTWVINEPYESLGYILYDNGFDVWLGNNRGNVYSLPVPHWQWSWDEMSRYDLPAFYEYVLSVSQKKTLVHVGHSEGTLTAFAAYSLSSKVQSQVSLFIGLAPVAWLSHQKSLLVSALAQTPEQVLLSLLGSEGVPPQQFEITRIIIEYLLPGICQQVAHFCDSVAFLIGGCNNARQCDESNLNSTRSSVYAAHLGGSSMQNLFHLLQLAKQPGMRMYDFGNATANMAHYGVPTPPSYNLTTVTLPMAFFTGSIDAFADPIDVGILLNLLGKKPVFQHNEPGYTHLDPIWGVNANQKIYPLLVQLAKQYSQNQ